MIQIEVNGERLEVELGSTVAELLAQLKLEPKQLAVELNEELVPRSDHGETVVRQNDRLEVVTLVGGG